MVLENLISLFKEYSPVFSFKILSSIYILILEFSNITEEKASYDLKIDIGDLVFLITGYFSIDDLVKLGKIDIKNKNVIKKLNKIFNKRNSYLYEFI